MIRDFLFIYVIGYYVFRLVLKQVINKQVKGEKSFTESRTTMKNTFILLTALLLLFPLAANAQNPTPPTAVTPPFELVENGQARGVIYLAPGSTPTASYAAEELRDHIALGHPHLGSIYFPEE